MIYTITLNPALDYYMDYSNEKVKKWNRTDKSRLIYGGKGINSSSLLTKLGSKNIALILSGGATGAILRSKIADDGIEFINFDTKSETRINVKAQFDDTYEFQSNTVNNNDLILDELLNYLETNLKEGDKVMIMGSRMKNLHKDIIKKLSIKINEKNAKVIYDFVTDDYLELMKFKPLVIKPNVYELSEIFDVEIKDEDDIEKYANKLLEYGAENVIISNAEKGAYLFNNEMAVFTKPIKINFVNGSGAGDSMIAGFVHKLTETNNYIEAINFANASGAGTASAISIAGARTINELFNNVQHKEKQKGEKW